jgi:hypothetical protein
VTALAYGTMMPNAAGYAPTVQLAQAWKDGKLQRLWRLGPRIITGQLTKQLGAGVWKAVERFPLDDPNATLDSLESAGVDHPSSWADTYHQKAPYVPRVKHTFNGLLSWWSGGPWSEARRTGNFGGVWYRYDLVSAYRWAATLGLPVPDSYRATRNTHRGGVWKTGIWVGTITSARERLPTVWRTNKPVVFTTEDVAAYGLRCVVDRGISWTETYPECYIESTLAKLPFPKEAGRAYWGRWVARDPLVVQTKNAEWEMRNIFANFVWGWLIVHRVRQRVWESAEHAAHVYVDEVLVPHEIKTGSAIGSWHLKEVYNDGITVRRTGMYGPRVGGFTMRTGHVN